MLSKIAWASWPVDIGSPVSIDSICDSVGKANVESFGCFPTMACLTRVMSVAVAPLNICESVRCFFLR